MKIKDNTICYKYKTRELEQYTQIFYKQMGFGEVDSVKIFRLLVYNSSKNEITCRRKVDESLKKELEKLNRDFSQMVCGEHWLISEMKDWKGENDDKVIFAIYNNIKEQNKMLKEYILYQIEAFFNNVCGAENIVVGDANIFVMNMIYEQAIAFIDKKIRNHIVSLSISHQTVVAEYISRIAYRPYEGDELQNKYMVFDEDKNESPNLDICFKQGKENILQIKEVKKIRKLLEITYDKEDDGLYLKCIGNKVKGYVSSKNINEDSCIIEFNGKGKWSFYYYKDKNSKILFEDKIVQISKNNDEQKVKFYSYYTEIFDRDTGKEKIWKLIENAKKQKHGTMLLFSENAEKETDRLCGAGYQVDIDKNRDAKYIEAVTAIDGAVLLDFDGKIHMIGVILDGEMPKENKGIRMERGARYNSAIKYSYTHKKEKHVIVVISEDGDCDFINYKQMFGE